MKNSDKPVMMYIHGFMSGSNGSKHNQLQRHYKNYRVITPELDADPDKSLTIINEIITYEKPEIIIGTSLGGWMTLMCDSPETTKLIIVNPSLFPYRTLSRWLDIEQTYFCKRIDGVQTYTLKQEVLDQYLKYNPILEVMKKKNRLYALCSTEDELIGTAHIDALTPLMEDNLIIKNDFGHQCRDAGMKHLYKIIDNFAKKS